MAQKGMCLALLKSSDGFKLPMCIHAWLPPSNGSPMLVVPRTRT